MSDSSKHSSLFALVDSHLSTTNLEESGDSNTASLLVQPLNVNIPDSLKHFYTRPRLPIPSLGSKESSIQRILDQQVVNMLRAKEKKQKNEKEKLEEEMKHLRIIKKNFDIDLMKAIKTPFNRESSPNELETLNSSSSMVSLFKLKIADSNDELERKNTSRPILPFTADMSYILKEKVKLLKCSVFGKVLTSRLRPVAAPYFREEIPTSIVRFDFSTPSPCDIVKENLSKPTTSRNFVLDLNKSLK